MAHAAPLGAWRDSAPLPARRPPPKSLEQAIALHGGEAQLSANRFYRLKPEEQSQVLTFLRSLVAPPAQRRGKVGSRLPGGNLVRKLAINCILTPVVKRPTIGRLQTPLGRVRN